MADKLSIADKIFLVILCGLLSIILGCSSAPKKTEKPTYECPSCGDKIDASSVNKNIRMENICPSCRKVFFYTPVNYQQKYRSYGPRNYGPTSIYQSDIGYQRLDEGGYSFKETPYGFTEFYWNFHDRKTKSYRVIPRWRTTRYHYP